MSLLVKIQHASVLITTQIGRTLAHGKNIALVRPTGAADQSQVRQAASQSGLSKVT